MRLGSIALALVLSGLAGATRAEPRSLPAGEGTRLELRLPEMLPLRLLGSDDVLLAIAEVGVGRADLGVGRADLGVGRADLGSEGAPLLAFAFDSAELRLRLTAESLVFLSRDSRFLPHGPLERDHAACCASDASTRLDVDAPSETAIAGAGATWVFADWVLTRVAQLGLATDLPVPASEGAVTLRIEPFFGGRRGGLSARGRF